jgi:hypothetical protein
MHPIIFSPQFNPPSLNAMLGGLNLAPSALVMCYRHKVWRSISADFHTSCLYHTDAYHGHPIVSPLGYVRESLATCCRSLSRCLISSGK